MFEHFGEISRWQMVQKSFTLINIILLTDHISISRLEELKGELVNRLSVDIEVEFLINEAFVMKNEGKINAFVSEIL